MFYLEKSKEFSLCSIFLDEGSLTGGLSRSSKKTLGSHRYEDYQACFDHGINQKVKQFIPKAENNLKTAGIQVQLTLAEGCEQKVEVAKIQRGGAIVTFRVLLGRLKVEVLMLNIEERSRRGKRMLIARGSFGQVLEVNSKRGTYVTKRVFFKEKEKILRQHGDNRNWEIDANRKQIHNVVLECAISKVCSALEIGPKEWEEPHFDLLCFSDSIEFQMEKCMPVKQHTNSIVDLEKRLRYCLKLLHSYGFIHKDIKPANLAFSPSLNDFVFIDFGISKWIAQRPGELSASYREGTYKYMCPQLRKIGAGSQGYIDLYWNDVYALELVIEDVAKKQTDSKQSSMTTSMPVETDQEDSIFAELYQFYKQMKSTEAVDYHSSRESSYIKKYFPEIYLHKLSEGFDHSKTTYVSLNPEFIIRSIGVDGDLLFQLDSLVKTDQRVAQLMTKLQSECYLIKKQKDIHKASTSLLPQKTLITYKKLLHTLGEYREDEGDLVVLKEEIAVLLQIADIYFLRVDTKDSCQVALRTIQEYQKKLKSDFISGPYIQWLIELCDSKNTLPLSTARLFEEPLTTNQKRLLIKCAIRQYLKSSYCNSLEIARMFYPNERRQQPSERQNTAIFSVDVLKRNIVSLFEHLLSRNEFESPEWLILGEFVFRQLIQLQLFDTIIKGYSHLSGTEPLQTQTMLQSAITFALINKHRFHQALRYCSKVISLQDGIMAPNLELLIRAQTWKIRILAELKQYNEAISFARAVIKKHDVKKYRAVESYAVCFIIVLQALLYCLLRVNKTEEAVEVFLEICSRLYEQADSSAQLLDTLPFHIIALSQLYIHFNGEAQLQTLTDYTHKIIIEPEFEYHSCLEHFYSRLNCLVDLALIQLHHSKPSLMKRVLSKAVRTIAVCIQKNFVGLEKDTSILCKLEEIMNQGVIPSLHLEMPLCKYLAANSILICYYYTVMVLRKIQQKDFEGILKIEKTIKDVPSIREILDRQTKILRVEEIAVQLYSHKKFETVLELLLVHQSVSAQGHHLTKAYALYSLDRFEECAEVVKMSIQECPNIEDAKLGELLELLWQATKKCQSYDKQIGKDYLERAYVYYINEHQRDPNNMQICTRIGICQFNKFQYSQAVLWFQKVVRKQGENLASDCITPYGICLNKTGKHKRALYYLTKTNRRDCANIQHLAKSLFYAVHSRYTLRSWRPFERTVARLVLIDGIERYTSLLQKFFAEKRREEILLVYFKKPLLFTTHNPGIGKYLEGPHLVPEGLSDKQTLKLMSIWKKILRFELILAKYPNSTDSDTATTRHSPLLRSRLCLLKKQTSNM